MAKEIVVQPSEVREFVVDKIYKSKMLLDSTMTDADCVQINEGHIAPGEGTGGAAHPSPNHEVYIGMSGKGMLHMAGKDYPFQHGSVAFIPGGTFHSISNLSATEELVIFTIWGSTPDKGINEVYDMRKEAWGKTFMLADECQEDKHEG